MSTTHFEGNNATPGTCRECGKALEIGEGCTYSVWGYDWDDPDTDAQGSISVELARYTVCQHATRCAERVVERGTYIPALRRVASGTEYSIELRDKARAILAEYAELHQAMQMGEDLTAREAGYGAIGGYRG